LNHLQLGCSAEYLVTLHFLLNSYNVYRAVVDDHGVDLLVRHTNSETHYAVQVKSCRDLNYIFFRKDKFALRDDLLAAVVLFLQGRQPEFYLIPAQARGSPNALLVSRDYERLKSKPEWGLNLTPTNLHLLAPYAFAQTLERIEHLETH
jgi:hypothetical protein